MRLPLCHVAALGFLLAGAPGARATDPPATAAALPALAAPVRIALDRVDVPTIDAGSLDDAVRAQGWIHARERFLQMDLARRQAAGELGQLVPAGIALDREARPLGLRAIAERAAADLPERHRALLARYAEGVNAFLDANDPLEYSMLGAEPLRWAPADTMLVQLGMARFLDGSAQVEFARAALYASLPANAAAFLSSSAGPLDASVDGSPLPAPLPLPDAAALNLRAKATAEPADATTDPATSREVHPGSNAFAIAGARTADGRAIVGNDMHLMLSAPGIWYRVELRWPEGRLLGLSLPGVPLIVQGTNGHVAWGFTNLTADLCDLVIVEPDPKDPSRYLIEGGSEPFRSEVAEIGPAGRGERLELRGTRWGPVVRTLPDGRAIALRWTMHEPGAVDTGLFDLATATTLESTLAAARAWRGPPQNVLVASADGRIGWTIAGSLPSRDRPTPAPTAWDELPGWHGLLASEAKPMIVDPPSGVLTSGNQLSIAPSGLLAGVLGGDEAPGDRALRLRRLLEARHDWTEAALHEVQLDVHSERLLRWRDALRAALGDAAVPDGPAARALAEVSAWDGHVGAESTAPVVLDAVRSEVRSRVAVALAGRTGRPAGELRGAIDDEALLRILESRAEHLLAGPSNSWKELASDTLVAAATASLSKAKGREGQFRTRGEDNRAAIRHPAASSLGAAARIAEMPRTALPGHPTAIRVQTPSFGASQRSIICPVHLGDAIMVTPCGQAGMPTSPHFRSLHGPWEQGVPFPLVPSEPARIVELVRELPPKPLATTP